MVVAQAGLQLPAAFFPDGLAEGRGAGDIILLVATQGALDPEGSADKVFIALAIIGGGVVFQAAGNGQGAAEEIEWLNPAAAGAIEVAIEIDHPRMTAD